MNIKELLSHPAIQLPLTRDVDDFQSYVQKTLRTYLDLLNELDPCTEMERQVIDKKASIEGFCEAATGVVRAALAGQPHDAYEEFLKGVRPLVPYILEQKSLQLLGAEVPALYRIRADDSPSLTREELFHIPFEKRHKVGNQRYSIPGLPCLYLSGSLYTCWEELGQPPFHKLHVAGFWVRDQERLKIVNLMDRPASLLRHFDLGSVPSNAAIKEPAVNQVVIWPLLALCSIIAKNSECPYKPEYILPQIVLQWVTKERFDGICYFSTHVKAVAEKVIPPCNFVFPAWDVAPKGRSARLRKLFRMTTPKRWELLQAINLGESMPSNAVPAFEFEFVEGHKEPYEKTGFGMLQSKLNKMVLDGLNSYWSGNSAVGMVAE
jgi:RES domain